MRPTHDAGRAGGAAGAEPAIAAAGVTLTPMLRSHIPGVMELERELFGDEAWSEAAFRSELADVSTRHYVVLLDGAERVVGYAGLVVYGDEAHVVTLGVTGHRQRAGLGTILLRDLLDEAARRGAGTVLLDVRADNPVAQRLYARHGFRQIGVRKRYYQPSGTDAVVMERRG